MLKRTNLLKDKIKADVRIENYLRLEGFTVEQKGSNYKTTCPFHADHDPSLVLSTGRQEWRCWVCNDGGDVIDFVQRHHGLSYKEALSRIANLAGIDLAPFTATAEEMTPDEQARFYAVRAYRQVAEWCHAQLRPQDFDFFSKRGITKETLDTFLIGYCPGTPAVKAAFPADVLTAVNILKQNGWNELGWNDVLTYPIFNEDGEIVAFHNRRYNGDKPKYVGTDTDRRLQKDLPYGVYQAKKTARGTWLMVEGNNDTLALHSHGFMNGIAAMTASGIDKQFQLLASLKAKKLYWIPDGDKAGFESMSKMPNVSHGVQVLVNTIGNGQDPDEFLYASGRVAFQTILDGAVLPIEFLVRQAVARYPFQTMTEKVSILQLLSPAVAKLTPLEAKLAYTHIADCFNVDPSFIEDYYAPTSADGSKSYDQDLERVILSAMVSDQECLFIAASKLKREDFFIARHAELFSILVDLSDGVANGVITSLNYEVISAEINKRGRTRQFDGGQFITGFLYGKRPDNFDFAIESVMALARRRRLVEELDKHKRQAVDPNRPVEETVSSALSTISGITLAKSAAVVAGDVVVPAWMDEFFERVDNKGVPPGLDMGAGFRTLNHLMGGLRKEALILIGGDSGVGKTNIALDWFNAVAEHHKVLYISAEMPENQLMDRLIAKLSGVSAEKISLGMGLSTEEMGRIQMAAVRVHELKQRFACRTGMTIDDVNAVIRHEHLKHGIEAVFVDYAQRITVPGLKGDNLYSKGSVISGALKDQTLALKIPVVLLVQLDRKAHAEANPDGANVAESYRYRQDADQFVIISKKSEKQMSNGGGEAAVGNSNLFLDKNRYGRDEILLDAMFDRQSLRWREMTRR